MAFSTALRTLVLGKTFPKIFPPHQTVFRYYRQWSLEGTIEKIHDVLRRQVRVKAGKQETPTAGIIDSQSVENDSKRGHRGDDAGKKVKGRKRHILVDTLGLIWGLVVHEGNIQDRDGAKLVFFAAMKTLTTLLLVWADGGYAGKLIEWVQEQHWGFALEIVKRSDDMTGFVVLPHRWIVERTFAWLDNYRLLSKEYEYSPESSQSDIYLAMIHLMLRRLQR